MALLKKHRADLTEIKAPFASQWGKIETTFLNLKLIINRESPNDSDQLDAITSFSWGRQPSKQAFSFGDGIIHSNVDRIESAKQQNECRVKNAVEKTVGFLDTIFALIGTRAKDSLTSEVSQTKKIFIVHGHDDAMKQSGFIRLFGGMGLKRRTC